MDDFRQQFLRLVLEKEFSSLDSFDDEQKARFTRLCNRPEIITELELRVQPRLEQIESVVESIASEIYQEWHSLVRQREEGESGNNSLQPDRENNRPPVDTPEKSALEGTGLKENTPKTFTVANASAGKEYAVKATAFLPEGHSIIDISIPAETGLHYDAQSESICGIPAQSGQFSFPFSYSKQPTVTEAELSLYVNADPKTLWQEKEPPENAPFAKAHTAFTMIDGKNKRLIAGRKRGRSHAHTGKFCDDDFAVNYREKSDCYIMAVADGAGSAEFSRYGSHIAVKTAVDYLTEVIDSEAVLRELHSFFEEESTDVSTETLEEFFYRLFGNAAHKAMAELLYKTEEDDHISTVRDLATTLLLAMAIPVDKKSIGKSIGKKWLCAAWWVGDGAVALLEEDAVTLLGTPDSGEFSGQTRFLDGDVVGEKESRARTRCVVCDDFTALILMTDGISDARFASDTALSDNAGWQEFRRELEHEVLTTQKEEELRDNVLTWFDFWSAGNHDDRTLAILYNPHNISHNVSASADRQPEASEEPRENNE